MSNVSNIVAILDKQPPLPARARVTADVTVANPGVHASLVKAQPQGINPDVLLLRIEAKQSPGFHPQVLTTRSVRYDESPAEQEYTSVTILHGADSFTEPFQIVH